MSDFRDRFIWYELMTEDQAGASAFYEKVLGWKANPMPMPGMPDATYTVMAMGEARVAGAMTIPAEAKAMGARPSWVGHVAVDDVDASVKQCQSLGGQVYRPGTDIPGIGRFAVLGDPDGATILIFQPAPGDPPAPLPGRYEPGFIGWRELMAGDLAKAFDFYAGMFGWTKADVFNMGEMGDYQLFAVGGETIGGMMTKPPMVPMASWGYYFNVEGVAAAVERVKAGGGTLAMGPHQVPTGEWIASCMDPQGVNFGLLSPNA